jgi:hypothetical protein
VLRLIADEQDEVLGIANAMGQVVEDSPGFHHAGSRDDDRGP